MTHSRKRALCWLYAALMTLAVLLFAFLGTEVRYAVNDDAAIMRSFLGYESGVPADFQIYIHGILAKPLYWLSMAFPLLPWFSYLQSALLGLACLIIAKSILQCFVKHEKPLWAGAVLALAFLLTLCLKYICRMTFTQTSALLGAAAVLQMLSIEHDRGGWRVVIGMLGALALAVLSYALRQITALPVLAFCGLAFVVILWAEYGKKRSWKPMLLSLALVAVVMGGLVIAREVEIQNSDAQDYLAWQESNTDVIDYYGMKNVPQEAYDLVGWESETIVMANKWCFLDSDISTEAFQKLDAYMEAHDTRTLADRLSQGWADVVKVITQNPVDMRCLLLGLLAGITGLICALCKRRLSIAFGYAAAALGALAMIAYLAFGGRLPLRALLMVTLPVSALFVGWLPSVLPRRLSLPAALLCAAIAVWCACLFVPGYLPNEEEDLVLGNAMGDLEEYALSEPESLFIYDDTLVGADLRAFPDYSEGMPTNITFWGGWGMRSPENVKLFERYGIDLASFDPETLLREDVFIASGRVDPPPTVILEWLQAKVSPDVDWEIWSEYGNVYIFHFYNY